jgi:hypothetical protein
MLGASRPYLLWLRERHGRTFSGSKRKHGDATLLSSSLWQGVAWSELAQQLNVLAHIHPTSSFHKGLGCSELTLGLVRLNRALYIPTTTIPL